MKLNKQLKSFGIVALLLCFVLGIQIAISVFVYQIQLTYFLRQILQLSLTFISGIIFLIYSTKKPDYLYNHKNTFLTLLILNIFNNFIVWIFSLIAEISVANLKNYAQFSSANTNSTDDYSFYNSNENNFQTENFEKGETISFAESDFEITTKDNKINEELSKLDAMKRNGKISNDDYEIAKRQILNKFS